MKRLMLVSLISCMVVGQVFCADNDDASLAKLNYQDLVNVFIASPNRAVETGGKLGLTVVGLTLTAVVLKIFRAIHDGDIQDLEDAKKVLQVAYFVTPMGAAVAFSLGMAGQLLYDCINEGKALLNSNIDVKNERSRVYTYGSFISSLTVLTTLGCGSLFCSTSKMLR